MAVGLALLLAACQGKGPAGTTAHKATAAVGADFETFDREAGIQTPPGAQAWDNAAHLGLQDLVGATLFGDEELIAAIQALFRASSP